MDTKQIEFFQNDGIEQTLGAARVEFANAHPLVTITGARIVAAYPGRPGEGRWVTIEVTYEE